MSKELFTRIITKDKVSNIPNELIHFFHPADQEILDIPLEMDSFALEEVRQDFGKYDAIEDLIKRKEILSKHSKVILDIIQSLNLKSFLIEHVDDWDAFTIEFIQIVIKDGKVIKGSTLSNTNEEGDLYSTIYLGYDYTDYIYNTYEIAKRNYHKSKLTKS